MSGPWSFVAVIPPAGKTLALEADEARHVAGARRLAPGQTLTLFDGGGGVAEARIERVERGAVEVQVLQTRREPAPEPAVHLAAALPKGDRQAVMLSMAVQLGVRSITPLRCRRSVARAAGGFERRAGRVVVEACKQCRSAHVPAIHPEGAPQDVLSAAAARGWRAWMAHRPGTPVSAVLRQPAGERETLLLIGPEGGFDEGEVAAGQRLGAACIDLGPRILRVETAAVAALAVVMAAGGAPGPAAEPRAPGRA